MPPRAATSTVVMDEADAALHTEATPPAPFTLGSTVEGYRFISILGQGSFATVYLAEELELGRLVALKVCPPGALEGRTIAQLNHEGIVGVHSQAPLAGYSIINMQYVASVTAEVLLKDLAKVPKASLTGKAWIQALETHFPKEETLSISEFRTRELLWRSSHAHCVARLGLQVAEAMAHAHEQGILHLDIKPSNLLMHRSGKAYLMDFNVSIESETLKNEVPENFGGTFDYMAPEQMAVFFSPDKRAALSQVGEHSDVCSLGLVLKQFLGLLGGRARGGRELEGILNRATAKDLSARYQTAKDLVAALQGYLDTAAIRSRLPPWGTTLRWVSRHPLIGLTVLGAIPQVLATIEGYLYNSSEIVSHLDVSQQLIFRQVNLIYIPLCYLLGYSVWAAALLRLKKSLAGSAASLEKSRRQALSLPYRGALVTSLSWLPGVVLFPWLLGRDGPGLDGAVTAHLVVSILLSYGIALAYSFVIHVHLVTSVLYPNLWMGESQIRSLAKEELTPLVRKLRLCCGMAVLVPLLSLLTFLYRSEGFATPEQYTYFKFLVVLNICPGTLGIWFAVCATERVLTLFKQFTAPREN